MKKLIKPTLIVLGLILLIHFILPRAINISFNENLWHYYPKYRYAMSHSLSKKINNEKLNYKMVINLIGQPDYGHNTNGISYYLRSNSLLGFNSDWLNVEFYKDSTKAYVYSIH